MLIIIILVVMLQIYHPSTGINIMLALDSSDRESGTVKIASTEHVTAEVKVKPESRRVGTPKLSSPKPNTQIHHGAFIFPPPPQHHHH